MTLKENKFIESVVCGSIDGDYIVIQTYRRFGEEDRLQFATREFGSNMTAAGKYAYSLTGQTPSFFCDNHPLLTFKEYLANG